MTPWPSREVGRRINGPNPAGKPCPSVPIDFCSLSDALEAESQVYQPRLYPRLAAPMIQRQSAGQMGPLAARLRQSRPQRPPRRAKGRQLQPRAVAGLDANAEMIVAKGNRLDNLVFRQDKHRLRIAGAERPGFFDLLDQIWRAC